PGGIRLQINLYFAARGHVSGLRVVLEIVSVNLVEAAGIRAVYGDVDIMQLGDESLFIFNRFACLDFEKGARTVGLGNGKTILALLDFNPHPAGNFLERIFHTPLGVEIGSRHDRKHENDRDNEPRSQAGDGYGHLGTVYWNSTGGELRNTAPIATKQQEFFTDSRPD